jgi:predicted site-specific integrase-resolvase
MTGVQPLLTAAEAAERLTAAGLPVGEDTVRRWGRSGRVTCVKLPFGRLRFRVEDIDALIVPIQASAA